jgi:hypothetical protein
MIIGKKYFNSCTLYILLWVLYSLQGTLYAEGSIISRGVLLLFLIFSGYYTLVLNMKYRHSLPVFFKVLNVFIFMLSAYGVFAIFDPTPIYVEDIIASAYPKHEFLKLIYVSLMPIYSFYYFHRQGMLTEENIRFASFVLLIVVTSNFIENQASMLAMAMSERSSREEFTNNISYDFLQLLPLAFFWRKKPLVQYLFVAYIFVFLVVGMKRGAIAIGAVCFLWFLYRNIKSSRGWNRAIVIVLTVAIAAFGVNYVVEFSSTSDYFQQRLQQTAEGNSSDRDVIFGTLWEHFLNEKSALNILFGNGAMQTISIAGNFAHNDWLEILICHGIVGIFIYILYFAALTSMCVKSRHNHLVYNILGMAIIIMFASTLFSMSYNSLNLGITLCLGYCLSEYNKNGYERK